jgi:hypothetical protein
MNQYFSLLITYDNLLGLVPGSFMLDLKVGEVRWSLSTYCFGCVIRSITAWKLGLFLDCDLQRKFCCAFGRVCDFLSLIVLA